jgi:hypothetical protein
MTPELRGIELSVQSDAISLKVTRFNPSLKVAHDKAMNALAILLEELPEVPLEVHTKVSPEVTKVAGSEPAAYSMVITDNAPPSVIAQKIECNVVSDPNQAGTKVVGPSKHQLCWTPERRKAMAERMRGNHIRANSVNKADSPPLAAPGAGKDYKSPNSVWKGTEAPDQ